MRPNTHFEIEFVSSESSNPVEARLQQAADVLTFAKDKLQKNTGLLIACLGNGVDYGNLIIEIDALGGASLRALEHSGFVVAQVSKKQVLQALEYWLPAQERLPSLKWIEE